MHVTLLLFASGKLGSLVVPADAKLASSEGTKISKRLEEAIASSRRRIGRQQNKQKVRRSKSNISE